MIFVVESAKEDTLAASGGNCQTVTLIRYSVHDRSPCAAREALFPSSGQALSAASLRLPFKPNSSVCPLLTNFQ